MLLVFISLKAVSLESLEKTWGGGGGDTFECSMQFNDIG